MAERAELGALLELCSLPHVGPARMRALLDGASAQEAIAKLCRGRSDSLGALLVCPGVTGVLVGSWRAALAAAHERAASNGCPVGVDRLAAHEQAGVWLEIPTGGETGEVWKVDPEPPALLFGRGTQLYAATRRVGIVGTRRCSAYGRTVAQQLGEGLAEAGVTVVSGLASGIDGIAQRAALDAGGLVIGVVGSGLDHVYPASNRSLWVDIAQRGTLLSEYPLGTPALRWRFPARNRIVAALCDVLVVVESAESGGSLYTVDAAAERGRPVMAVPGPITSDVSMGTNRLLAEGCPPVCDVGDILLALGWSELESAPSGALFELPMPESPLDRTVLDELGPASRTADELVLCTGAGLAEVAASLGRLELSGWAAETAGWWERTR
ncbi:DNA-processing protein DprA [Candidatus Poriferisodalis sp.]|uniref:DNA-processing protein DprA n=1 Tax=Candidatus Poriferisodalis sp. TaxID=3101277 RepID=UPI003D0A6E5B